MLDVSSALFQCTVQRLPYLSCYEKLWKEEEVGGRGGGGEEEECRHVNIITLSERQSASWNSLSIVQNKFHQREPLPKTLLCRVFVITHRKNPASKQIADLSLYQSSISNHKRGTNTNPIRGAPLPSQL